MELENDPNNCVDSHCVDDAAEPPEDHQAAHNSRKRKRS